MTPEEQARLLARWLDHPDEPVADGLDEDVVEAVVALRPELAPPPRVTPDEILDLVSAGPLAASAPGVVDEAPVTPEVEAEATPVPVAEVVALPTRRWGRWAAGGVVGLMVAAAAALLVIVPGALVLTGGEQADQAAVAPTAAAPRSEVASKDALQAVRPAEELEWAEGDAVADLGEAEPAARAGEDLGTLGTLDDAPEAVARGGAAGGARTSSTTAGRQLIPEVDVPLAEPADATYDAVADLDLEAEKAEEELAYGPTSMAPAPEPAPVATGSVAKERRAEDEYDAVAMEESISYDLDDSEWSGLEADAEAVSLSRSPRRAMGAREAKAKRDRADSRTRGGGATAPAAPAMDEAEEDDLAAGAKVKVADAPAPPPPVDLAALRAEAMPTDYAAATVGGLDGSTRAALEASQDAATKLAGERSYREAGDTLAAHIAPPPEVGMDQAAKAALYYQRAGDPQRAVAACQAGLALSTANTPARSYLLVIYGDALRQSGDTPGATSAYREAITLNGGRGPSGRYYDVMEASEPAGR